MAAVQLDKLLTTLMTSGIQQSNNPLFQVISQLIQEAKLLEFKLALVSSGSSSSSSTVINNSSVSIPGMPGNDGDDGMIGPPGIRGIDGVAGAIGAGGPAGPITVGPMGLNGEDGLQGFPIPGNIGATGSQGIQGPAGPITLGPMGLDGEDGLMGFPIPGPAGADGSSAIQAWEGQIVACFGNGDPNVILTAIQQGVASPTPTNISVSLARLSYFKLSSPITVANIRWYGVGSLTAVYHIAIYRASDNVRMSADNNPNTVADSWNAVADSFTLAADTLYYAAVSVDTTGTTAGIVAFGGNLNNTAGAIKVLPASWPGSLLNTSNYVNSAWIGQVAVTTGALPNPGNSPAVIGTWTGGMPAIFLDAA